MPGDDHVTNRLTMENKQLNSLNFCMFVWTSIQNLKNSSGHLLLLSFLGQI